MTTSETIEILQKAEQDAREEKLDKAIFGFQYYLTMEPDSVRGWKGLYNFLYKKARFEEALEPIQRLVSLCPMDGGCFADLADILWRMKKYQEAIQAINRSIALDPGNSMSYIKKYILYAEMGNDIAARDILELAQARFPEDSRVHATFGVYAEKMNLSEEALGHFRTAWRFNHLSLIYLKKIGDILLALGRIDEARKTWEMIAKQEDVVKAAKQNLKKHKLEKQ